MAILGNPILALEDERELILFSNGVTHPSLGGFRTVQGTVNKQTDTLSIENGSLLYYENDNDYGAILSNNAIDMSKYNILRVTIKAIKSWQDAKKFWASVLAVYIYDPEHYRLNAYGFDSYEGNAVPIQTTGGSVDGSFIIDCPLESLNKTNLHHVAVTCASSSSTGNGILAISDIRLLV